MSNSRTSLFFLIASLGFMSGLPASLFASTLQAWFAQSGASVLFVSNLGLISFVFFLRVFLSPFVDQYFIQSLGRRKTWIIATQISLFILIEGMALLNPSSSSHLVLVMAVLLALMSCIQDLVIDAHRIEYLPSSLYGYGAVVAIYACRLALLLSGGGALIFANVYGFGRTYAALGFLFLFSAIVVYFSQEPSYQNEDKGQDNGPFKDFLLQPKLIAIMGFVFFIKFGEVFVANASPMMIPFMLQGLGLSLVKVAYVNKVFGLAAQLVGGLISAILIKRFSLLHLLLYFGFLEIIANFIFVILSLYPQYDWLLWSAVAFENLASGLASTALVVFLMQLVNPRFAATHYSIWIMFAVLPRILAGPIGGYVSTHFGWPSLFQLSTLLTSIFLVFWWQIKSLISLNSPGKIVSKLVKSS
jgi:PAT family beta-lactamase induction signal transducer AmpG